MPSQSPFRRHIAACHNARLPGARVPFRLGGAQVGWVLPETVAGLAPCGPGGVTVPDAAALDALARALAARGACPWRGEAFDVRATPQGPSLGRLDRGALPLLGVVAEGVHMNGLVTRPGGDWLWVGRRSASKLLDPGKLDHLVAGGVPAGLSPRAALAKEAEEEAGIPAGTVAAAVPVATLAYAMERPEGLRRDRLHCFDLHLPETFRPVPVDGEVEAFELWPLAEVFAAVRDGDAFKFNVNLVLIDLFLRRRLIDPASEEGRALRHGLDAPG